jgi:hypothetical protein
LHIKYIVNSILWVETFNWYASEEHLVVRIVQGWHILGIRMMLMMMRWRWRIMILRRLIKRDWLLVVRQVLIIALLWWADRRLINRFLTIFLEFLVHLLLI